MYDRSSNTFWRHGAWDRNYSEQSMLHFAMSQPIPSACFVFEISHFVFRHLRFSTLTIRSRTSACIHLNEEVVSRFQLFEKLISPRHLQPIYTSLADIAGYPIVISRLRFHAHQIIIGSAYFTCNQKQNNQSHLRSSQRVDAINRGIHNDVTFPRVLVLISCLLR